MIFHLVVAVGLQCPLSWVGTQEYLNYKTFLHRFLYYNFAMTGQRFMYYSPWCLSDSAMIACGLAYNGTENGKHIWDRIYNISIV